MAGGEAATTLEFNHPGVSVDSERMNPARIVVLTIALGAGGVAAYLARGSDNKPLPSESVAQLQTVDVLVAKSDIGLGQSVTAENLQWQTWPAGDRKQQFHSPQRTPRCHQRGCRLDCTRTVHSGRTDP